MITWLGIDVALRIDNEDILQRFQNMKSRRSQLLNFMYLGFFFLNFFLMVSIYSSSRLF